jgi:hypothetical protein
MTKNWVDRLKTIRKNGVTIGQSDSYIGSQKSVDQISLPYATRKEKCMKYFMKRTGTIDKMIYLLAIFVLLVNCGGGGTTGTTGSMSSANTPVIQSQAVLYVTDSFREDFAHVWATIYHVDLIPQSGSPVVLFDNPNGVQIDLKTLRDSTGARFSFLGEATVPQGTYTGINVTIGSTMQLFKNGVTVGDPLPVDPTIPTDASGHPVLTVTFAVPKTLGAGTNALIVDFDLARFIVRDSKILPLLKEGDPAGCNDPNRHNPDDYRGTVSNLSGTTPDLTFTLVSGNGQSTQVVTNASTAVYGASSLVNRSRVIVTGTLDSTTGNLVADRLNVLPTVTNPPSAGLFGTASNLDATAGTFTATLTRAHGFIPAQTSVKIVTNSTTKYIDDGGGTLSQADFFTALATTPGVTVEGSYDETTNTLTAVEAKIMDQAMMTPKWEVGPHLFRPGVNRDNWGHGIFR